MKSKILLAVSTLMTLAIEPVWAAGGTGGVGNSINELFTTIQGQMTLCSAAVVTCAVLYCGYKVLFQGVNLRDLAGPIIGAILIAAAPWVANLLVG